MIGPKRASPLPVLVSALVLALPACTEPNPGFQPGLPDGAAVEDLTVWETLPPWDLPPPDEAGLSCEPGAFLDCPQPTMLLRCNPAGTSTVTVNCSPYLCNPTTKRCNQCDPGDPPHCVGNSVVSCTPEGKLVVTNCPTGCDEGACSTCLKQAFCKDADYDGFGNPDNKIESCDKPAGHVPNCQDCNDSDYKAHPGQTDWFTEPSKGGYSFDYNCNGKEEPKHPDLGKCSYKNGACTGDGWGNFVPDCGDWGFWADCQLSSFGSNACKMVWSNVQQPCH